MSTGGCPTCRPLVTGADLDCLDWGTLWPRGTCGCSLGAPLWPVVDTIHTGFLTPPVYGPKFASGHDLWRLGMPKGVTPDDPRIEPGEVGELLQAGPPLTIGGFTVAAAEAGVSFALAVDGSLKAPQVQVRGKDVQLVLPRLEAAWAPQAVSALRAEAGELLAYARHDAAPLAAAAATALPWSIGQVELVGTAATSTFVIVIECARAGYLVVRPDFGHTRPALFRISTDGGKTWSMPAPVAYNRSRPETAIEPKSTGLRFQLGDGGAGTVPFLGGERWVVHTRESEQIDLALRANAAHMVRYIRCSTITPLLKWEPDLTAINATLTGGDIMGVTRGQDAPSDAANQNYDAIFQRRYNQAWVMLKEIREGYAALLVADGSGEVDGMACISGAPQGLDLG